jgi:hypothetical protein
MAVMRFGRIKVKIRTPSHRLVDMLGQRFGRLTVVGQAGSDKRGAALWICRCDCGGQGREATIAHGYRLRPGNTIVRGDSLRRGATTSCRECVSEARIQTVRQKALDRPPTELKPRKPRKPRPRIPREWRAIRDKAIATVLARSAPSFASNDKIVAEMKRRDA